MGEGGIDSGVGHEHLARRTPRPHRRSQAPGNPGLPADQGAARIRRGQAGADLALRQARLSDPRRHPDHAAGRGAPAGLTRMLKVWGRNTSVNVQKVMWAIGELGLACERIDVGGAFGKNNEPAYLAMNPNGLVPTLEEDGFLLWESNSVVRYLAAKYGPGTLEPADLRARASASRWMDWQLTVCAPAIQPLFWGLIRPPPEKRDPAGIDAARVKTTAAMKILDA